MSVCNLNLTNDHVWLASDTLAFVGGKPYCLKTKFSTFPHLYALVAFRGLVALHHRVDEWLNGHALDVEAAAARLPDKLRGWQAELRAELPGHDDIVKGQTWLCGWKPSTKSFGGWHFSSDADFEVDELPVPTTIIAPGCEAIGWTPPAVIDSPDRLVRCVEAQKAMSDADIASVGGLGIGGEVILVQLDKSGFAIRKVSRFSDYEQTKELLRADA